MKNWGNNLWNMMMLYNIIGAHIQIQIPYLYRQSPEVLYFSYV